MPTQRIIMARHGPHRRQVMAGFAALAASTLSARAMPVRQHGDSAKLGFREIAPGVHVHEAPIAMPGPGNLGDTANLGFVVGEEGVAVIDSGGSPAVGRAALAAIREVTDRPVRYLVNTHMHPDHTFGNQIFAEAGATLLGHRRLAAAFEARAETYVTNMGQALGASLMRDFVPTVPQEGVEGERVLDLGNRKLVLKTWDTAHTDNDLTVLDATTGTLFAGDLLFVKHIPTIDGSLLGWLAQREALEAVPASQVVPGHGPVPSPWPHALAPEMAYFELLANELREAIAEGMPLTVAASTIGRDIAAEWQLASEYHERNVIAAYAEIEWE